MPHTVLHAQCCIANSAFHAVVVAICAAGFLESSGINSMKSSVAALNVSTCSA